MNNRKRQVRIILGSIGLGGCIAAAALNAAPAHASPQLALDAHSHDEYLMCTKLAHNPTLAGVEAVAEGWILQQGNDDDSIALGAKTLTDAVTYVCPEYYNLVQQWAAIKSGHAAPTGTTVGNKQHKSQATPTGNARRV